ncbi:hypothetical protein [Streptococcus phage smHBZ8]|nr:hypothetical protein [Streptococcus phage smHBZ8]
MRLKKFARPKKGRGLGYMGAKRLISWEIGEEIEFQVPDFDVFVDAFGGGGSMSCEFLMRGKKVMYNDLDKGVHDVFKYAMNTEFEPEFYNELLISRAEFKKVLNKKHKTVIDNLKLLINSFGNRSEAYLYSKEFGELKFLLAKEILKDDAFGFRNYRKNSIFISKINNLEGRRSVEKNRLQQLEQLKQLEQLQRLQQLLKLNQLRNRREKDSIVFENLDYKSFITQQRNKKGVLYCDIPYKNTKDYSVGKFDHKKFFNFISEEAKYFKAVFVSSYQISDDGFKLVKEFKKKSTLASGTSLSGDNEKLYTLKDFELARQMDIFDYLS